ncbi:MAG: hypothetical protein AUG09_03320 [Acidobacteria bacterium 13_1_20CM_2_68_7]|nr:MAG: hypothetical protein AUG09_03320 [Acidobacteria bacterium 13_1_20CM_2_68_7]
MSAFPRGSAPTASPPAAKAGIEVDDLIAVLRTRFNAIEAPRVAGLLSTQGASGQLAMLARAGRQEVGPLVARTMMELPGLASDALVAARRIYFDNLARNLYLRSETAEWVACLGEAGIPCWPLKGVGASLLLYDDIGARQCDDIDLLVRVEDRERAQALAVARGFEPAVLREDAADSDGKAVHLEPQGAVASYILDLHWRIELPRLVPIEHADFWTDHQGGSALPLDLVGTVLCLHLWRHAVTLKTLTDMATFVTRYEDEIPLVRARLARARAGDGVDLALALVERIFGVRSRFLREHFVKRALLPLLARSLRRPFSERGPYFGWLVFPLQCEGLLRPVGRAVGYWMRPGPRHNRLHPGPRLRRLARVLGRTRFGRVAWWHQ